jgi:DNA/RNA-binding domain of Phe-tRNA-synthetase-like protein
VRLLAVADDVRSAFPGLFIVGVHVEGLDNRGRWPDVDDRIAAIERTGTPIGADDPRIASWHTAYRRFGTNPRRQRPSVDALTRRLARSGRLPRISPFVDSCNLVSVTHGVPAGAFDLDRVDGQIAVRFARSGDAFTPLGEPDTVEEPHPGEVVYADAVGVLTRHWNHRDADRTKVTAESRRVLAVLEAVDEVHRATVDAAARDLAALLAPRAKVVTVLGLAG